jgi:hypothetical protein
MADIKLTGYINDIRQVGTGTVAEVAEKHSRKNPSTGMWEPDGTATYYDVWVDRAETEAGALEVNSLVTITGSFKTKKTEKEDGRVFYSNVVNARTITKPNRGGSETAHPAGRAFTAPAPAAPVAPAPVVDINTPF